MLCVQNPGAVKFLNLKMHFVYETKTSLTACFCYGTYAFQSESTLYICLNVK